MPFLSMYGTDGCGKSTIAKEIANSPEVSRPIILGGSSYKEWLSEEVARDIMGARHSFGDTADSPEAKTRLYEDIAIVCYGFARQLSIDGYAVIIDSDPYLKRIVWGTLHENEEHASAYVERLNERMADFLPDEAAPRAIAGINVAKQTNLTHADLLDRLSSRGGTSDHDPKNIKEVEDLDAHVRKTWELFSGASLGKSALSAIFRERIQQASMAEYENGDVSPEELPLQVKKLSHQIITKFY